MPYQPITNWTALTLTTSGQHVLNYLSGTGFLHTPASGLKFTLEVKPHSDGTYVSWPALNLQSGLLNAYGEALNAAVGRTWQFDARGIYALRLTVVSGSGQVLVGQTSDQPLQGTPSPVTVSGFTTSDVDLVTAISGRRILVCAYSLVSSGSTASTALFKSGTTSPTEVWRVPLRAGDSSSLFGANLAVAAPGYLFRSAPGEKLALDVDSSAPIHYSITYWVD